MSNRLPEYKASISLEKNTIVYRLEDQRISFPVNNIQVIGEFSSEPGKMAADYFFSFKIRGVKDPIDVPAYADGLFELLADLKKRMPEMTNPRLQMCAVFNSNILYPQEYEGYPLYIFIPESKPWINLPLFRHIAEVKTVTKALNPVLELN